MGQATVLAVRRKGVKSDRAVSLWLRKGLLCRRFSGIIPEACFMRGRFHDESRNFNL